MQRLVGPPGSGLERPLLVVELDALGSRSMEHNCNWLLPVAAVSPLSCGSRYVLRNPQNARLPGRDEHVIVGWKTLELDSFLRSVFGPTPAARSAAVELIWQRAVDYIPIRERLQPLLPGLFG